MPQGLEVYSATGALIMSIDDRVSRILGELTPSSGAGSHDVSSEAAGDAWFMVVPRSYSIGGVPERQFSASGSVISWGAHYSGGSGPRIIYGVY